MREFTNVPGIKCDVPFGYAPRAPFGFSMSPATYDDDHPTLDAAIAAFARDAMPRDPQLRHAAVFDADGVIVVGYLHTHHLEYERWHGLQVGFDALARCVFLDPLEVTCAEISARLHAAP